MIGYVTVGTKDLARATQFYDALFGTIGGARFMESDRFVAWGVAPGKPGFSVALPYDGQPASAGNGNMTAIVFDTPAKVDAFHAKVIELGGTCEGKPGARSPNFYAAYFRDLDGNKLNAFCMTRG